MKTKIDSGKVLSVVSLLLGAAGMIVTNKMESHNRNTMKTELKEEIMKDLLKSKN